MDTVNWWVVGTFYPRNIVMAGCMQNFLQKFAKLVYSTDGLLGVSGTDNGLTDPAGWHVSRDSELTRNS